MKYIIVLLLIAICNGCSSTAPTYFTVDTTSRLTNSNILTSKNVTINVTDLRLRQDILQLKSNGKFSYIPSQVPTTTFIKQGLTASFNQQLTINTPSNNNVIHVNIEKMAVKLNQETFAYDTQSLIVLVVTINNGNKTLTKTFKRQGTSKGPLKADFAVLEQNFNQLLKLLFDDISKDSQVIDYLTGTK